MIIKPKVRGFICTTAHPVGCAKQVQSQIAYARQQQPIKGPKNVLIIGASTGYGLASRIVSSFTAGAKTIAVFFEKSASDKRTASAGWYNSAAFEDAAQAAGYYTASINGDAFSDEIKNQTIALIKESVGQIDLVLYSLATPRRVHPTTKEVFNSALKTTSVPYTEKSIDPLTGMLKQVTVDPATQAEINDTIKVMGGEDWQLWMSALEKAKVLAPEVMTVAYSYIGPELTYPIYRQGTIGKAKEDLEKTADALNQQLSSLNGRAFISVNKALVTQASAAIPVVPLYISLLYKVMKNKGVHEGCIEQIYRLFEKLYAADSIITDEDGRIRLDDYEMRADVQSEVSALWPKVNAENVMSWTDIAGYRKEFFNLFGFEVPGIDYEKEVDPNVSILSIKEEVMT